MKRMLIAVLSIICVFTLSGQENNQPRVIKIFPSALLPPVSDPYYFYWDFGTGPETGSARANLQGVNSETKFQQELSKGKLPVRWLWGPQRSTGISENDFVEYYKDRIRPFRAYLIDEWQAPRPDKGPGSPLYFGDPFGIRGAITGIVSAKAASPSSFILVAWRGESSLEPLVRQGGVDLIAIESYQNMPTRFPAEWGVTMAQVKARINLARSWGMIEQTIPWIGQFVLTEDYHQGMVLDRNELENQIRTLREYAPEMPGIAFYGARNSELVQAAEELCEKYFREPAPQVQIMFPYSGEKLSIGKSVFSCVALPKSGRGISFFEGFVDNKLVYRGSKPSFEWDLSSETPGIHYITFHAVDDAWNRGSSQVSFVLEP